jgi:hypothetical protein
VTYDARDLVPTDPATIQYRVVYNGNTYDSPVLPFGEQNPNECVPHGLWGMLNDGRVGGYFQPRANTGASLKATWNGITYNSCSDALDLIPANVWIGLKNSDDVGTRFDLEAEVFENGSLIGSGQINNVPGGSSGFNNAVLRTIAVAVSSPGTVVCPGDTLSIKLSVRIGATGHRSGTARLWYNDSAANSHFDVTVGGVTTGLYLRDGFVLGTSPGPKKTIDVFVDRAVGGNPFKPFGTWSKTF